MSATDKSSSRGEPQDNLIRVLAIAIVLGIVAFAAFYYFDRYSYSSPPSIDREISELEKMVMNDPDSATVRIAVADRYLAKKLYAKAMDQYQEALKLDEKNDRAWFGIGYAQLQLGKNDEAVEAFTKVLEPIKDDSTKSNTPGAAGVRYYLAVAYTNQGELDKAVDQLQQVLQVNRADADAIYQMAVVLFKKQQYDDAIQLFTVATDYVPDYTEAYQGLADVYKAKEMTAEADYAQGMVLLTNRKDDDAIGVFRKVIAAKPDLAGPYFGLGMALERKGKVDDAKEAYLNAVKYRDNFAAPRAALARLGVVLPPMQQ